MELDEKFFADLNCPNAVTWTHDIAKLFTATDKACMKPRGYDLSNYDDVKAKAKAILGQVAQKKMPKGAPPWSQEWINTFACWVKQQCPK